MTEDLIPRVAALEAQRQQTIEAIDGLRFVGRELTRTLQDRSRTPWSILIGWGSIILALVGMAGGLIARDVSRVRQDLREYIEYAAQDRFTGTEGRLTREILELNDELLDARLRAAIEAASK
jgi:hypothetical protein